jgi:hypothetical protein
MIDLLVALVGNLVSYLRTKSEFESVTPDTAFRFNSKDCLKVMNISIFFLGMPKAQSGDIFKVSVTT